MSEYPIGTATAAADDPALASTSDGRPCGRADVMIVDAEGVPVPVGAEGDVIIRGPGLFKGYYKRPDLDADSRTTDGYLRTGDRARLLDDRGHIRISGRTKDIIIRGGENIPVVEIENILLPTRPSRKSPSWPYRTTGWARPRVRASSCGPTPRSWEWTTSLISWESAAWPRNSSQKPSGRWAAAPDTERQNSEVSRCEIRFSRPGYRTTLAEALQMIQ